MTGRSSKDLIVITIVQSHARQDDTRCSVFFHEYTRPALRNLRNVPERTVFSLESANYSIYFEVDNFFEAIWWFSSIDWMFCGSSFVRITRTVSVYWTLVIIILDTVDTVLCLEVMEGFLWKVSQILRVRKKLEMEIVNVVTFVELWKTYSNPVT